MSRVERVEHMLQAIEYETSLAFNEHTVMLNKNQELEAENTKLRKELNHWRVEQTHAYSNWQDAYERAKKCEDENAKLREQLEYDRQTSRSRLERIDQLKAENAKLRKKINALKAHGIEIVDAVAGGYEIYDIRQREVDRLEVENGKLREALRAAWKCAHAGISCSDCRLIAGGCTLQTAMQELGIEVS